MTKTNDTELIYNREPKLILLKAKTGSLKRQ